MSATESTDLLDRLPGHLDAESRPDLIVDTDEQRFFPGERLEFGDHARTQDGRLVVEVVGGGVVILGRGRCELQLGCLSDFIT